jgi:dipeptidyl aminopeptidase/acylaminoacyl peptidase
MFPGMEDTLIAARFGRELRPDEGVWSSSAPGVVHVGPGGVVRAVGLGEAVIRLDVDGAVDSLRIRVVEPPEGQIVFGGTREFGDPQALWIMSADGTGLRQLWHMPPRGLVSNPDFSPDGCWIVFQETQPWASSPRLRTIDIYTRVGQILVEKGAGGAAWSPDGKRIAFSRWAPGFEIFSIRPDGTGLTQHTRDLDFGIAIELDFFPDSRRLVFTMDVGEPGLDLYWLNLETGARGPIVARRGLSEQSPAVSPDGRWIAFEGPVAGDSLGLGGMQVHILGPDSVPRLVTLPSRTMVRLGDPDGAAASASGPSFSPDGEWLAISWTRDRRVLRTERTEKGAPFLVTNTMSEIYVIRRDGSLPVRLTHFAWAYQPDWGPDCTKGRP